MRLYKGLFCAIILLVMANNILLAQKLKLVRTDVDSTRFNFVTATYLFGIDVFIEGIDSCTSVSFDLNYTTSNYITFSEARSTHFGYGGKGPVIITSKNASDNTGYVYVGVLSGEAVGERGFDNPKVIHLEFAVSQSAEHGYNTVFSFSNVQAVISRGDNGRIISVAADPIEFSIHSFINVWPGDADNDGEVTSKDVTTIGRFLGYGSSSKTSMRSFKRMNASTIWAPQSVLAWDSIDVAHADCDGNGDITVTDQLIVALNFAKTHLSSGKVSPTINSITNNYLPEKVSEIHEYSNYNQKEIIVNSSSSFLGVAGEITWTILDSTTRVIGFSKGDVFGTQKSEFFHSIDKRSATISLLNFSEAIREEAKSGTFCTMIIDGDPNSVVINKQELYAISNHYGMFKIQATSDVEHKNINTEELSIIYNSNEALLANNSNFDINTKLYNSLGQLIAIKNISAGSIINISNIYNNSPIFVVYQNSNKEYVSIRI